MARADSLRMRAGQLFCACDSDGLPLDFGSLPKDASVGRMASAFSLTVFAQVLVLSVLPLASASVTPAPNQIAWPYLAMLAGAALASFPASALMDMFGRKSAFALGASLGIAGGILAGWATLDRQFTILVLGALWLGMAQGFGLFYRHAGAIAAGAGGAIFGAGVIGAVAAPFVVQVVTAVTGPLAPAWVLVLSGLAHLVTLALAAGLPARSLAIETLEPLRPPLGAVLVPTGLAALAWAGMTAIMARAPLMMAGCGIGLSMTAMAMAVHLTAMYLPGFVIGRWIEAWGGTRVALFGLIAIICGGGALALQGSTAGFSAFLALAGFGWGTATIGATAAMHRAGRTSPVVLAAHDAILFISALLGAFLVAFFR